jgi:hypothetical protein
MMENQLFTDDIRTELKFMAKEARHETEKAYELRYLNTEGFPRTNISPDRQEVTIRNFRALQTPQSFEEYGFFATTLDCPMAAADFDDDQKVEGIYYPAVKAFLQRLFPDAAEIGMLEHTVGFAHLLLQASLDPGVDFFQVRKREPAFTVHTLDYDSFQSVQPADAVHIGIPLGPNS